MSGFPRADYGRFERYTFERAPAAVDLSDNTNLWGAHPDALAALASAPPEVFTKYPSLYADALRSEVARTFGVDAACVTTGCGSDDVLDSAIRAAGRPPGLVVYAAPTFSMADVLSRMNGLDTLAVPWPDALADPARLLEPGPTAVYVCCPNNPTGAALPEGWIEDLFDRSGPDGPLVILDEAYAEFEGRTRAALAIERGRSLVVHTLSKLYALAGARVGYGIGREDVIEQMEKSRGPYKVSSIAERAGVAALRDASGWAANVVREVRANRQRLGEVLHARGLAPLPSAANFLLLPTGSRPAADVGSRLLERGVAVRPFPNLAGIGDGIRVTVGPWPMMEAFLDALDEVWAR